MKLPRVETVVRVYPASLAVTGALVLVLMVLSFPPSVSSWPLTVGVMIVVTVLRRFVVPLSKYSYLSFSGFVALAGSLLFGPVIVCIALAGGALAGDWGWLRKSWFAAAINGGREVLSLTAAFGLYVTAQVMLGVAGHDMGVDLVPALAFYVVGYLVISRLLFYFTLLLRSKLTHDEASLVLRYEVIGYFASVVATVAVLIAVDTLEARSWPFVGAMLAFGWWMVRRLLEEAIAAEERTKVLAVDMAVTADLALGDALERIGALANRLVEWSDFRVYRRIDGSAERVYRNTSGGGARQEPGGDVDQLRTEAMQTGKPILVRDAKNDARITSMREGAQSVLIIPLRFGEQTVGTLELEHAKRNVYGPQAQSLAQTLATQIASAMHIANLREPLLQMVEQIGAEVRAVAAGVEALRRGGTATAQQAASIEATATEQERQVQQNLEATEVITEAARPPSAAARPATPRPATARPSAGRCSGSSSSRASWARARSRCVRSSP